MMHADTTTTTNNNNNNNNNANTTNDDDDGAATSDGPSSAVSKSAAAASATDPAASTAAKFEQLAVDNNVSRWHATPSRNHDTNHAVGVAKCRASWLPCRAALMGAF